jgi:SAM-dependent methyltransferase
LTSTKAIYDKAAPHWVRNEKRLLSDFTARPYVMEKLQPLAEKRVLDLGCGEGYVSRQIKDAGAASVLGIDISAGMVEAAQAEEARSPRGIVYEQGDAATLDDLPEGAYDRVAAVFLFNYVDSQVMTEVMRRVRHWLAPGGRFVFTIPHPSLPFIRAEEPPFFFQRPETGYFSTKDMTLEGSIWGRDGHAVPVRCVHKPLEVYFQAMRKAGWTCLPDLVELRVRPEHIELDPEFFGPLLEEPLHILFSLER